MNTCSVNEWSYPLSLLCQVPLHSPVAVPLVMAMTTVYSTDTAFSHLVGHLTECHVSHVWMKTMGGEGSTDNDMHV